MTMDADEIVLGTFSHQSLCSGEIVNKGLLVYKPHEKFIRYESFGETTVVTIGDNFLLIPPNSVKDGILVYVIVNNRATPRNTVVSMVNSVGMVAAEESLSKCNARSAYFGELEKLTHKQIDVIHKVSLNWNTITTTDYEKLLWYSALVD